MSALSSVQQEWAENKTEKKITGVMLWDLSAAFNTLSFVTKTLSLEMPIDFGIRLPMP